jgi:hypothetical protein
MGKNEAQRGSPLPLKSSPSPTPKSKHFTVARANENNYVLKMLPVNHGSPWHLPIAQVVPFIYSISTYWSYACVGIK